MREFLASCAKVEFDKVKQRIAAYLQTPVGVEHLGAMAPAAHRDTITEELLFTSEMKRLIGEVNPVPLNSFPDLRVTLQRASIIEYVLPAPDLLAIGRLASNVREIKSFFAGKSADFPRLSDLASGLHVDKVLEYNISRAIDDEGMVSDGASRELQVIRRALRRRGEMLRNKMESILTSLQKKGVTQEDLITTRDGRLVIPVRAEFKNQVPGFIHSISASGATAFIEPTQTLELNNELRSLESQEAQEIHKILAELTKQVRENIPGQMSNIRILGRIDFLNAKARYSAEIEGHAPTISTDRALTLRKALHPLLLTKHRREEITPLDLAAGGDFNTLIISGPNAGGKSVAMKTVGLLTVMAHSGCHIPASPDSVIPLFGEIFVEMGDEQSIENDLSTFSSHLKNLKIILDNSTAKSLVLIDEIGNGTDPALGSALGIAVLESLSARDALTIVTSHHSAFKTCGFESERMENAGMGFDGSTLKPNYRLSVGVPGNSYALEIARNLDFPEDILRRSFELTGEESVKLTDYLSRLENRSNELEKLLGENREEKRRLDEALRAYEERLSTVNQESKAIRSKARLEAAELVRNAKGLIEKVVREIRESEATSKTVRDGKEQLSELGKSLKDQESVPEETKLADVRPGDTVTMSGTDMVCEVTEILEDGRVRVLAGGKHIIVARSQLQTTRKDPPILRSEKQLVDFTDVKNEIDLRGHYGDEALEILERFLDRATLAGLPQVRIIHGKGTGALRKRVTEYLSRHKNVASYQFGEWNEGGSGVTVAKLSE